MRLVKKVIVICFVGLTGAVVSAQGQTRPSSYSQTDMSSVAGRVIDAETGQPIAGAVVTTRTEAGKMLDEQTVKNDGGFRFTFAPKQTYVLATKAAGYQPLEERLVFTTALPTQLSGKPIRLKRIKPTEDTPLATTPRQTPPSNRTVSNETKPAATQEATTPNAASTVAANAQPLAPLVATTGTTTQLRSIQFVQSKPELLPESQPAMNQLLTFMRDNPTVEIELSGHTDNQGDFDQNMALSKQRVEVVKDFLVKNGIKARRISTKGYGPTRPIASNNSEDTRRLNRRVEMMVLRD